jgi:microcompartment protein CcmK/EutM
MMLGRVIGNVVSTAKHGALEGKKLLVIQPITKEGRRRGPALVALDAVGAGEGEVIYWCRGREASLAFSGEVPCDAAVVGIVDQINVAVQFLASASPGSAASTTSARPVPSSLRKGAGR